MISFWILDLRRALYSLWIVMRYGATPLIRYLLRLPLDVPAVAARLRFTFETLGLTYMKLGQYLASRVDLLPPEICQEFNRLFEQATPVDFEQVRRAVESELGRPLAEVFAEFCREPIAAASVAQVHEARTRDGDHVAVKVQRPGVARLFYADMRNLGRFAAIVDALGLLGTVSMRALLDEFAWWTARELNFVTEGRTADRLRRESIVLSTVPRIYWDLTTTRVLTLEFIEGMSLAHVFRLINTERPEILEERYPGLDLGKVAENLSSILMHQLFVTGFFHGDPHPGNIFLQEDNTIVLLDFGIFGELSEDQREYSTRHIESVALGDIDTAFRYYAKQLMPTDETDMNMFEQDGKAVLRRWYKATIDPTTKPEDRHLGKYAGEILAVARRHHVQLATDTLLFWRALEVLDATALRFSGHFDLLASMRAFFERIRPSPAERLRQAATDKGLWITVEEMALKMPYYANRIHTYSSKPMPFAWRQRETSSTQRARNRRAKWLVLQLLWFSGAVFVARSPGKPGPFSVFVLVLALLVVLASVILTVREELKRL